MPHSYPSSVSQITLDPHIPLGGVMLSNRAPSEKLGLLDPIKQLLGKGAFGAAYEIDLGGKSVLKFTRDPTEATACSVLKGKYSKHIVDIHGIWVIVDSHKPGLRGWYAVHRSYMSPLSKKDAQIVDMLFDIYNDMSLDLKLPRPNHRAMADKWRSYLREDLIASNMEPKQSLERGMLLLRQISDAVFAMHSMGIDWEDIHSGNLMRRDDGTLAIADVGWGFMHKETSVHVPPFNVEEVQKHLSSFASFSKAAP